MEVSDPPDPLVAVVGLGANLGSRVACLRAALDLLEATEPIGTVHIERVSRLYESDPMGPPQPRYFNAAARVRARLDPQALLSRMLDIERALGRERDPRARWQARTIDLDLLWARAQRVASERLTVPHPRLGDRPFALAPLLDVAPELTTEHGPRLAALGGPPPSFDLSREPAWQLLDPCAGGPRVVSARGADTLDAIASALLGLVHTAAIDAEPDPRDARPLTVARIDAPEGLSGIASATLAAAFDRGLSVRHVVLGPHLEGRVAVRLVCASGVRPERRKALVIEAPQEGSTLARIVFREGQ